MASGMKSPGQGSGTSAGRQDTALPLCWAPAARCTLLSIPANPISSLPLRRVYPLPHSHGCSLVPTDHAHPISQPGNCSPLSASFSLLQRGAASPLGFPQACINARATFFFPHNCTGSKALPPLTDSSRTSLPSGFVYGHLLSSHAGKSSKFTACSYARE